MDLAELTQKLSGQSLPPVHLWEPEFCGDMDLIIRADGTWHYMGSPIGRQKLVKLFSTVLRLDDDGEYYLVTPVEKLRIQVEDAPFLAVEMDVVDENASQQLVFRTNVDDMVVANKANPIVVHTDSSTGAPRPYVHVRAGLNALIGRTVYYQLVNVATVQRTQDREYMSVMSQGEEFELGVI